MGKVEFLTDPWSFPTGRSSAPAAAAAPRVPARPVQLERGPGHELGGEGLKVEPDLEQDGDPRYISAIEESGDGKLVVAGLGRAGHRIRRLRVRRYLPSGDLDPGFGENGLTTVPLNEAGTAIAMDQAPNGKIVATGDTAPVLSSRSYV